MLLILNKFFRFILNPSSTIFYFIFSVPKPVLELATRTDKAKRVDESDDIRNELSNLWGYSHLQKKLSMDITVHIKCYEF